MGPWFAPPRRWQGPVACDPTDPYGVKTDCFSTLLLLTTPGTSCVSRAGAAVPCQICPPRPSQPAPCQFALT